MHSQLVTLVAGLLASGATMAANTGKELKLVERVGTEQTIDVGPQGDSLGDMVVFTNYLYDAGNVRQLGTAEGFCLRQTVGKTWYCSWISKFENGQIATSGLVPEAGETIIPIVGGTGGYVNARGELHFHMRSENLFDLSYELH
jgi:allene oxide cyclase